jgi:hypothetical protein
MYWQNKGDYLCVVVDRYTKSKKVGGKVVVSQRKYGGFLPAEDCQQALQFSVMTMSC